VQSAKLSIDQAHSVTNVTIKADLIALKFYMKGKKPDQSPAFLYV
jgi:hypothetical protein